MNEFRKENDELINTLFEMTFFKHWREGREESNFRGLEFIINYNCNLGCKYCYVNRFGDDIYPPECQDPEDIEKNLEIMLDWIIENKFKPQIEIFAGETSVQEICLRAVERTIERLAPHGLIDRITIPTNFTFLLSKELTERMERLLEFGTKNNVRVLLSTSIDGKHCESNRPFKASIQSMNEEAGRIITWDIDENFKDPRTDKFYDDVFAYTKKHKFGFHPMIYSHEIDKWKDNFLWFQEMFKKHDIPWTNIYLLEVRNVEWSKKQMKQFGDFVEWLIKWSWNMCGRDKDRFVDFLFRKRGFNLLANPFTTIGRGLGCSLQSDMYVRLGDLSLIPCHRQGYQNQRVGKFNVEDNKITGITVDTPELIIAELSMESRILPYCENCVLNQICSSGCLGAQYEVTGDPFTPIPTVCMMEYEKVNRMLKTYKELGILYKILSMVNESKRQALLETIKVMEI